MQMRSEIKGTKRVITIVVIFLVIMACGFCFLRYQTKIRQKPEQVPTQVEQVLSLDEEEYPQSVREVIRQYNKVIGCLYNEEYSKTEFAELVDFSRKFLDDEFLESSPKDSYLENLKQDIERYHENNKIIVSSAVDNDNEIRYKKMDGDDCANVRSSYYIKENGEYSCIYKMYVMRKDTDGNWKILVSYQVNGDSSDDR